MMVINTLWPFNILECFQGRIIYEFYFMVFAIHFEKFTNNLQKTIYFGNFGYVIQIG